MGSLFVCIFFKANIIRLISTLSIMMMSAAIDFMTGDVLEGHLPPQGPRNGAGVGWNQQRVFAGDLGNTRVSESSAIRIGGTLYVS